MRARTIFDCVAAAAPSLLLLPQVAAATDFSAAQLSPSSFAPSAHLVCVRVRECLCDLSCVSRARAACEEGA